METKEIPFDTILTLAQQLIRIPSTANNIAALNEAVLLAEHELKQFTCKTFSVNGKPNLLIHNATTDTKHFKIIFNAHLDVVQGSDHQYKPFNADGKLYGRGAYDMKAAAAVQIALFQELAHKLAYPLALQITTDEETGTLGAKKQVDEGLRAEFVLTGECGSNLRITNKTKGIYHIKLTATGKISHSAYPWQGDNAIIKLQKALAVITETYPLPKEETESTTVNITMIRTNNDTWNRTPDHAEANLDIRYVPEDSNLLDKLQKLLPQDVTLEVLRDYSYVPINTKLDNPYIKLLQQAGKKILEHDITLQSTHATSDLVRFAAVGCDGVEFGPIGANQHGDNEWVDLNSLEDYYHILKQFLLSIE